MYLSLSKTLFSVQKQFREAKSGRPFYVPFVRFDRCCALCGSGSAVGFLFIRVGQLSFIHVLFWASIHDRD